MAAERLIAVFGDREVVDRITVQLGDLGVAVNVGAAGDAQDELRAEMAQEGEDSPTASWPPNAASWCRSTAPMTA